ncbi:MAG TPA: hypothetical protein PLZ84_01305 [Clostridia bacterium]|nr:hypothetical protein [Clostridia bacterium]
MKNRTKIIIAGSAVAALLAANYAPAALAGDDTLLSQLYDIVVSHEQRIKDIENTIASLNPTPTEAGKAAPMEEPEPTPSPTPTPTPEPFRFTYYNIPNTVTISELRSGEDVPCFTASLTYFSAELASINEETNTCSVRILVSGKFEVLQPDKANDAHLEIYITIAENGGFAQNYVIKPDTYEFTNFETIINGIPPGNYEASSSIMIVQND